MSTASRTRPQTLDTTPRIAWFIWAVGVTAYGVAVFQRFSLGVAGILAAQRFGISAAALATFTVVQLAVYAGLQIPVGVLLDRYGSKRLLVTGAGLMAVGQLLFAIAHSMGLALVARILLGAGDAMTFVSVLRLVVMWFPPRRNPLLVQLTAQVGQLGAIASAAPLVAALHGLGWTPTYAGSAVLSVVIAAVVVVVLRDAPFVAAGVARDGSDGADDTARSIAHVRRDLRAAWDEPGTRLGLATHFVTQFPGLVFAMLWGFPFLVEGEGLTPATAGALLTLLTVVGMVGGPLLGIVVGRLPFYRSWMSLTVVAATAVTWGAVLLWPGRAPLWLLVLLVVAMSANGPASAIGFDYARTFNPARRLGSATGIVNVGGFVATLITIALIGVVLDHETAPGSSYSLDAFRVAFAVQYLIWAVGVAFVLRFRRRARRMHELTPARPHPHLSTVDLVRPEPSPAADTRSGL